jgi:uncharacterized protein YjbI with pentapeptide repeats
MAVGGPAVSSTARTGWWSDGSMTMIVVIGRRIRSVAMSEKKLFEHQRVDGVVFRDCSMARSIFDDVNLLEAVFSNVNLRGSRFSDVNMKDVTIDDANIEGLTIFGYDIQALIKAEMLRNPP